MRITLGPPRDMCGRVSAGNWGSARAWPRDYAVLRMVFHICKFLVINKLSKIEKFPTRSPKISQNISRRSEDFQKIRRSEDFQKFRRFPEDFQEIRRFPEDQKISKRSKVQKISRRSEDFQKIRRFPEDQKISRSSEDQKISRSSEDQKISRRFPEVQKISRRFLRDQRFRRFPDNSYFKSNIRFNKLTLIFAF